MEHLPLLPSRVPPRPGESLLSLFRRNALAMGYERVGLLRAVLSDRGALPPHLNHLTEGATLEGLSQLFGLSTQRLGELTLHDFAPQLVLVPRGEQAAVHCDSKTLLRFFRSSSPPICPLCLESEPPYERLLWSFRPAPVCLAHCCLLVDRCPACRRSLRPGRLDVGRCRCGFDLRRAAADPISTGVLRLCEKMLGSLAGSQRLLPEMSLPAAFWWAARLMSAALKTPSWLQQIRERHDLPAESAAPFAAWLAAAEMLDDWPQRFEQFLEVFQTVTKHRTTDTGLSRSFGLLLRDAAQLEQGGHLPPAEVLRAYLLQRYTRGHLTTKVCLFKERQHRRLVERRPWLTQTAAAHRLGLRQAAVADLLQRGLLEGEVRPAGRHGRSVGVVSRRSLERLKRQLSASLSAKQAASRLGIGRHRVLELIHADLLTGAVRTARGWRIPEPTVAELVNCYHRLPILKRPQSAWLSLRQATRQFGSSGLTLVRLMEFVFSGRLRARRSFGTADWRGLQVQRADLQQVRPEIRERQNQSRGYPLNRLCQELIPGRPLKDSVLRKWIRAGLLRAERRGRMRLVAPAEVARFRATYCLAHEVCDLLRVTRSTLTRWEAAGKIAAVYSRRTHLGAGASLFLRTDVTQLLATRQGDDAVSA